MNIQIFASKSDNPPAGSPDAWVRMVYSYGTQSMFVDFPPDEPICKCVNGFVRKLRSFGYTEADASFPWERKADGETKGPSATVQ